MWMMCDRLHLPPNDELLTFSSESFISSSKVFSQEFRIWLQEFLRSG